MTRPRYEALWQCAKCELIAEHSVRYSAHRNFSGAPVDEHLLRTCLRCGYEWEQAVRNG